MTQFSNMSGPWFAQCGNTGTIRVQFVDENWYVVSGETTDDVKCHFQDESEPGSKENRDEIKVEVEVSKYISGKENRINHLFVTKPSDSATKDSSSLDSQTDRSAIPKTESAEHSSRSESSEDGGGQGGNQGMMRTLDELRGEGEYISVEATVDSVFWVKKDESGIPDIKGELTDESVLDPVTFVVRDGVKHPYLGEGNRFLFRNVKDYYYSKHDELQVVITEYTDFEDRDRGDSGQTPPNTGNSSSGERNSNSGQSSEARCEGKSLHDIAREELGDETFTVEQNDESLVGGAKRKAKNQQRDPAIDPRLQDPDENEEDDE